MASTPTSRNRLNQQGTGDNVGSWGNVLNTQALALIDEALDGITTLAVAGNVTLSSANYATDQARRRVLKLTGAPGASYTVTIPSVEKVYEVINATNAAQIIRAGGVGASIPAGIMTRVVCDGTDCYAPAQTVTAAIGTVCDFAGAAAPSGWLLCNGQAVSRATYAALFGVIGATYGAGDGSTTFNVPDLCGRVTSGLDNMGSITAKGRLTGYTTVGVTGGAQTHTLSTAEIPPLSTNGASVGDPTYQRAVRSTGVIREGTGNTQGVVIDLTYDTQTIAGWSHTHPVVYGGGAHTNVQPTMGMNKIIYAGV